MQRPPLPQSIVMDQHLPKDLLTMVTPATEIVTLTPVGMPQVVQMWRQACAAVPSGTEMGIGMHTEPKPSGRFRQTLWFSTVTLMHSASAAYSPPASRPRGPSSALRFRVSLCRPAASSACWTFSSSKLG